MEIGFAEDFTSSVQLDTALTGIPSSGIYLNSGAHPSITLDNLLHCLPDSPVSVIDWDPGTEYGDYNRTRNRRDLVNFSGNMYQSLADGNLNNPVTDTDFWLPTNMESLYLKEIIHSVKDKVYSDLNITRRLVNNQYIYELGKNDVMLPGNYCAWVFEPKGSDYVKFRINEIAIQANTQDEINLYVINQGRLINTLVLTPDNGVLNFSRLDFEFYGKGKFIFAIDSQSVKIHGGSIDPLKYNGFIAYTSVGIGSTPESAEYSFGTTGNGLGFNITAYLDASTYIENNMDEFSKLFRACFEYTAFQTFLYNSNTRSNREQRNVLDKNLLIAETKDLASDTAIRRYNWELKRMTSKIEQVFDTHLGGDDVFEYEAGSI